MAIEPTAVYNEPLLRPRGDKTPKLAAARPLDRVVQARLELERALRTCGNAPDSLFRLKAAHTPALLAMLSESDSPLGASLRARAAGVVGQIRLKQAAPVLKRMALDEEEDLQTRINAVCSYFHIRGYAAAGEMSPLLQSKEILIRAVTYIAALKSPDSRLASLAEGRFKRENDLRVQAIVKRRVPRVRTETVTQPDA